MCALAVRETGYTNYWEHDGRTMVNTSSWVASEREKIAYEIYQHTEFMFYCSSCGCRLKTFSDHFTKCTRCRRQK